MTLEILSILGHFPLDIERLNRYSRIGEITYIVFFSRYPYLFEINHLIFDFWNFRLYL